MKKILEFSKFITEAEEIDEIEDIQEPTDDLVEEPDFSAFDELKEEVRELIQTSLGTSGEDTFDDFIDDYIKNPDEVEIEGFINDSDVYEFYLKWRDDIDSLLSEINYYDEIPSELKVFSLYDYVVQGTKRAINEIIILLNER